MTPRPDSLSSAWNGLPATVREGLLMGSVGKRHLISLASQGLSTDPEKATLWLDMLLSAWSENPLDGSLAAVILASPLLEPLISDNTRAALKAVADFWREPDNLSYFQRTAALRDYPKLRAFIQKQMEREPNNIFWRQKGAAFGLLEQDWDWVLSILDLPAPEDIRPCLKTMAAQTLMLAGEGNKGLKFINENASIFGPAQEAFLTGQALLALDDREGAASNYNKALKTGPWRTSLALRLHDLKLGLDRKCADLEGGLSILLYSWNKGGELDETLKSIFESDLPKEDWRLIVLDNGSEDATPQVLDKWSQSFGTDRFMRIDLPVNIGAPAARNWLMNLPEVRDSEFALYLDDDAVVPRNWLGRLGAAVRVYPDAGVWGCKVSDHASPAVMQAADYHFLSPDPSLPALDMSRSEPNPFRLSNLHLFGPDNGMFDYIRPCASVTGCCHLFRTSTLLDQGGFSLYLSPSQYDDMEHDLRLARKGLFAVYQGHLRVLHKKSTGAASRSSIREESNALGNKYKMQAMHSREEISAAAAAERELLERDLLCKLAVIETRAQDGCVGNRG